MEDERTPAREPALIKIYQRLSPGPVDGEAPLLAKFNVSLPDRPGSLAGFASRIARAGGNISFFTLRPGRRRHARRR